MKGIKTTLDAAKQTAKVGTAWGAAYGGSEVLHERGAPTTLAELQQAAPQVLLPAAVGAVAGPALGVPLRAAGRMLTKSSATRALESPDKTRLFAEEKYYPAIWREQALGRSSAQAQTEVRKKFGLNLDQEWQIVRSKLDDIDPQSTATISGKAAKELAGEIQNAPQGNRMWSTAFGADDAGARLNTAKALKSGDSIFAASTRKGIDTLIRPIGGAIRDISPRTYKKLVDMEGRILAKTHGYHAQFHGFMKDYNKLKKSLPKADRERLDMMLYNNKLNGAREMFQNYGNVAAFDKMRAGLTKMEQEMKSSGIEFESIIDYFPRVIKDLPGLQHKLATGGGPKGMNKYLDTARRNAKKKGHELSQSDEIKLINRWMSGKAQTGKYKDVGSARARKIQKIDRDLVEFYHDPATSLELHLREAVGEMERRTFFGEFGRNVKGKGNLESLDRSVGALIKNEGLTSEQQYRMQELLMARFGKGEERGWTSLSNLRQMTGGLTLGNPISALRQLGDIPVIGSQQGYMNTIASMFSKQHPDINPKAFGYMLEMAQELDTGGVLSSKVRKTAQGLYKLGFRQTDQYTKGVLMRATLKKSISRAKTLKGQRKMLDDFGDLYTPQEMRQLIDDLGNNNITDLVKSHVNAELMQIQPISRTQMPLAYLNHPNGRMFYQFRTWGLNQIELIRRQYLKDMKSGDPSRVARGASGMAFFAATVGATNMGITEIQRMVTGREGKIEGVEEMPNEAFWQLMGNFALFDRYGLEKTAEKLDVKEYLTSFIPPALTIPGNLGLKVAGVVDTTIDPTADVELTESLRDALKQTGIGRNVDFWFMGGAEEFNEKQQKTRDTERRKSNPWAN
jgi:hypothetical protein